MNCFSWRRLGFRPLALIALTLGLLAMGTLTACQRGDDTLTVYSGRTQSLVHPLLESFSEETGIDIRVKYAGSAAIASTILEEGENTPADVVFLQDPGFPRRVVRGRIPGQAAGRHP